MGAGMGTGMAAKEQGVGDRDREGGQGIAGGRQAQGRWSRNVGRETMTGMVVEERQWGDGCEDGGRGTARRRLDGGTRDDDRETGGGT